MIWHRSHRADPAARAVADRHYNRQSVGHPQFVPPGRCLVLYASIDGHEALWITSFPFAQYVKHRWAGAWICSAFRNEGAGLSSDLIRQALAATRHVFGDPPLLGMISFVDPGKIRAGKEPGRQVGRCFIKAGFEYAGMTASARKAKPCFQILPAAIPEAEPPLQMTLASLPAA